MVVELFGGASSGDANTGFGEVQRVAAVVLVLVLMVPPALGVDGALGAAAAARVRALAVGVGGVAQAGGGNARLGEVPHAVGVLAAGLRRAVTGL